MSRSAKVAILRAVGYTQAEIADELGVAQQTISRDLKMMRQWAEDEPHPPLEAACTILRRTRVRMLLLQAGRPAAEQPLTEAERP